MNTELSETFQYVPKYYHWILRLMEGNELKYTQNQNVDQNYLMESVKALIKWMNHNNVCQPFWLKLMYHLVKSFKITILKFFRQGFKIILTKKITQWLSQAIDLVRLLLLIGKQIKQDFAYNNIGLIELSELIRVSVLNMPQANQSARQYVQLNDTQCKIYRFIVKAGGWVKSCKLNIQQVNIGKKETMFMGTHFKIYKIIKDQESFIDQNLRIKMTCFEACYYNESRMYFKKFQLRFKTMYQMKDPLQFQKYIQNIPQKKSFGSKSNINKSRISSDEFKQSYELGTKNSKRYQRIPKQLRYVCELLENKNSQYVSSKKQVDPKQIMLNVKELCFWLSENILAKKLWFWIVERLVLIFKLSILSFLKEGLRRIQQSSKKVKLFKKRGKKFIAMIWKIILQVSPDCWFITFNLYAEWRLCQYIDLDRFCINKLSSEENMNVKLTLTELQVYRLLANAQRWAMKLRKRFEYKICIKTYNRGTWDLEECKSELKQIQIQRIMIQENYVTSFNIFQNQFYRSNLTLYFRIKKVLEELVEMDEIRENQQPIKERKTHEADFSENSDTEFKKYDRRESQFHRSYSQSQRSSSSRDSESESEVESDQAENESSQMYTLQNQQENSLKRQQVDRRQSHEQNDQSDSEQGEMSMDQIYVLPPSDVEIKQRKIEISQVLVKKEMTMKEEHIQRLRNSIRQKMQSRRQAKLQHHQQSLAPQISMRIGECHDP